MTSDVILRPHQEEALEKMHNGCILTGGVGTGKTITGLSYALTKESGKHIYVVTTAKVRDGGDWERTAMRMHIHPDNITVDSWNNIAKYAETENAFFIFDEQRVVGTGAWTKTFWTITKKNRWVLLSGTPGDTWSDYVPVFVANGFYKNVSEFRGKHVVYARFSKYPKIERYTDEARLIRLKKLVVVPMPMDRHTTRHVNKVEVEFDQDLFNQAWKKRWHVYEDRPLKDAGELFRVGRKIVGSHPSRLEKVRELLREHPKLIVFYNFDYELAELRKLAWEPEIAGKLAEWNGHKHENVPQSDRWLYLVQYTAGAEGWNCTTTDAMCFYSLTYSYKIFEQAQGRIDRMDTPFKELHYYILLSRSIVDKAVWRALQRKKDFNTRGYSV